MTRKHKKDYPHRPHHHFSPNVWFLIFFFLFLTLFSVFALRYITDRVQEQKEEERRNKLIENKQPLEPDAQYSANGISFSYPSKLITIEQTVPERFQIVPENQQPFLRVAGKMFGECTLFLVFTKTYNSSLIALDITETSSTDQNCWTYGYLKKDSIRTVTLNGSQQEVTRYKWKHPFGDPDNEEQWQYNWHGDYFQSVTYSKGAKTIRFGLLNQIGTREETEKILDYIINTFSFNEKAFIPKASPKATVTPEQVFCTLEAKLCPDGSSVGRVPPTCEFAACPGN